jgi:hypothetical protein
MFLPSLIFFVLLSDLDVSDVIEMVHVRGGVPTLAPRQYSAKQLKKGNGTSSSQKTSKKYLTTHGALINVKADLEVVGGQGSPSKRDILEVFRERERINQLPTFSSTPGGIRLGDQRRREIEADVLGTPRPETTASVPATSLIHQQTVARHRGHMASMGDMGAYSAEAEKRLAPPPPPPPPAPPATSPQRDANQMETKSEIQAMREKLEQLKQQNAYLSSENQVPPPAPPTSTPPAAVAPAESPPAAAASPSSSLAEKIARIKAKATKDLEHLWTSDTTKAKSVPLPTTDHGVNNNWKITNPINPINTPVPQIVATPSLSEMLRRKSTAFDGSKKFDASDFQ